MKIYIHNHVGGNSDQNHRRYHLHLLEWLPPKTSVGKEYGEKRKCLYMVSGNVWAGTAMMEILQKLNRDTTLFTVATGCISKKMA